MPPSSRSPRVGPEHPNNNAFVDFLKTAGERVKSTFAHDESSPLAPLRGALGRARAAPGDAADAPVPGDGARLGAVRDRTELFARLRETGIFIRTTEAKARAEDALADAKARGFDSAEAAREHDEAASARRGVRGLFRRGVRRGADLAASASDDPSRPRAPPPPLSASALAVADAAKQLAEHVRKIERALLPQYVAFVDSLRASAAEAAAEDAPDAAQRDVETHLATLLLVEAELQSELKKLKAAHARASAIQGQAQPANGRENVTECPAEALLRRNVTNAHAVERARLTRLFQSARDRVSEMLAGNKAARAVARQRLLRAADAARADLERFYRVTWAVHAELGMVRARAGAARGPPGGGVTPTGRTSVPSGGDSAWTTTMTEASSRPGTWAGSRLTFSTVCESRMRRRRGARR